MDTQNLPVMIDSELTSENYKQIEDIIDARKKLGFYNVYKQENTRYTCSNAAGTTDRFVRFDDTMLLNDGPCDSASNIKLTDSEVTIVRVRCGGTAFKRRQSKWDMHDAAIPGDGSHLGESPSLVNLATLVQQGPLNITAEGSEYLVPLSSWDPYYKWEGTLNSYKIDPTDSEYTNRSSDEKSVQSDYSFDSTTHRSSLAGRISKFIRKHCKKSKTLSRSDSPQNQNKES